VLLLLDETPLHSGGRVVVAAVPLSRFKRDANDAET